MSPRRYRSLDWYDAPRYYDIVFDADTAVEADFLEAVAARFGRPPQRVLEPACGSGRLVAELARRGRTVAGFDRNDHMLAFTRRRLRRAGLSAALRRAELEDFTMTGWYDLAHCLVSTFKYLESERAARAHLQSVASHLYPHGLYVIGLHLSEYDDPHRLRERWVGQRNGTRVVCNIQQWPPNRRRRRERVRSRLTVTEQGVESRYETNWEFRSYDAAQLRRLIDAVPAWEHIATFDFTYTIDHPRPLDGEQLDVVLVLRKRDAR